MASSDSALGAISPEVRASLFHFAIFGSTGIASVYFAIWLSNRGISPDETGVINAAPVLVMLLINLFVGRLADKASDWRQAIIVLALIAGAVPFGLYFVSGFWGILLCWTLCVVPAFSLSPVTDAATVRMTQRRGTDFGVVRAWGTVGYMIATLSAGPVITMFGDAAFVPLFVVWSLLRAALSLQLPRFRGNAGDNDPPAAVAAGAKRLGEVLKPWFMLTLFGLGLHLPMHSVLSIFGGLLWKQQGISEAWIGPLIAFMAGGEALMMFVWTRLNIKISARHMILIAALLGAARWTIMAFEPPLELLFVLQLLHSITYAVAYFGGIRFIANWTSENIAAEAQGLSVVIMQGLQAVALVIFGWCVAQFGAKAWLASAAFSFMGAVLVYLSLRLQPAHR